jgi:hypothetical protein
LRGSGGSAAEGELKHAEPKFPSMEGWREAPGWFVIPRFDRGIQVIRWGGFL